MCRYTAKRRVRIDHTVPVCYTLFWCVIRQYTKIPEPGSDGWVLTLIENFFFLIHVPEKVKVTTINDLRHVALTPIVMKRFEKKIKTIE